MPGSATRIENLLKLKNYNELRADDVFVPRILLVVLVPDVLNDWLNWTAQELVERRAEEVESRSQTEIVEGFSFSSTDIVRPSLTGALDDGTISVEDGKGAYSHARALMLSAACTAVEQRELYAKRKPERAMNYFSPPPA